MSFIVTDACIACKYTDCVEVCPVDCFHEGENMLVIDPDECIDCGACEPACPTNAIIRDVEDESGVWTAHNEKYAAEWPVLAEKKDPLPDAEENTGKADKLATLFSPKAAAE